MLATSFALPPGEINVAYRPMARKPKRGGNPAAGPPATTRRFPLTLLIKPVSARCNLACPYCFYRRVEAMYPDVRVMPDEVLSEMIRQLLEMRQGDSSFAWQGGEPLLAGLDFFKKAVEHMKRCGAPGQRVANALQTNGVLLNEEWAEFLVEYSFLVGVSIDGPKDLHDAMRPGSFDRAMRGARVCTQRGVEVNILAVVSRASEGRAREIYHFLKDGNHFRHLQFIPCTDAGELSVTPEGWGDFLIELFETWKEDGHGACIRLFDALVEFAAAGMSSYCIIGRGCGRYLLVEATGDVYPCDFFAREEERLGNLLGTPLPVIHRGRKNRRWAARRPARPRECADCPHWDVCAGGCLKDRVAAGGYDRPGYLCKGIRRFLDHARPYFKQLGEELAPRRAPPPRVAPARRLPRANDPCPCGSGRKFKHCCGRRG